MAYRLDGLRRLLGGVAWIGASGVCGRLVAFSASIVLAHTLGPSEFGVLAFGLSLALVFSACASLGLDELVVREFARQSHASRSVFADALILRVGAVPVGIGGALLVPASAGLTIPLAVYAILNSALLSACAAFRGRGRMHVQALLIGGQAVVIGVAAASVARLTGTVDAVAAAYVAGTAALVTIAYWLLARSADQPRFGWRPSAWLKLARTSAPFAVGAIGLLALDRVALTTISLVSGPEAAGWFGAVHTIVLALSGLATTATMVAFPILAHASVHDRRAAVTLVWELLGAALALGVSLCLVVYFLAPILVPTVFGSDYLASVAILQRIAFSLPAVFVTIVLVGTCEATDRQTISARAVAIAFPIACMLCLGATWFGGYLGGAAAYSASHTVLAGVLVTRWVRAQ